MPLCLNVYLFVNLPVRGHSYRLSLLVYQTIVWGVVRLTVCGSVDLLTFGCLSIWQSDCAVLRHLGVSLWWLDSLSVYQSSCRFRNLSVFWSVNRNVFELGLTIRWSHSLIVHNPLFYQANGLSVFLCAFLWLSSVWQTFSLTVSLFILKAICHSVGLSVSWTEKVWFVSLLACLLHLHFFV